MNVSPISMNNTNNYSTKKLNNPNFKQVMIQRTEGIEQILKDKSVLKKVTDMAEILENASSNFFDSVIEVDKCGFARFFMKFKNNFSWPWNSGENIYTSPSCNADIGKLKISEGYYTVKVPIELSYKDDKGIKHSCNIDPASCRHSVIADGKYEINFPNGDSDYNRAEAAVKLDELLNMMANGEVYGKYKEFGYKLQWHPFPETEDVIKEDMDFNEAARKNALVSTDEKSQELLEKYGE